MQARHSEFISNDQLAQLTTLEIVLHQGSIRHEPKALYSLLHQDFVEFGRSGRIYNKAEIVATLGDEASIKIWAQDFALQPLAPDVALLTYKSAQVSETGTLERHTLRSSIWKQSANGWQIIFHHGTATEPFTQTGG